MPPRHQENNENDGIFRHNNDDDDDTGRSLRQSVEFSTLQQIDPNEPVRRPSVYRRKSFIVQFAETKGPPQITLLMMLVAIGLGSTIGVVPAVMTDRFATLRHGYDGEESCSNFDISLKPKECLLGSSDAQNAAATAHLFSNVLTFLTSSLMGSFSDEHGRRGILIIGLFVSTLSPLALFIMQLIPTMSPWWYYGVNMSTGLVNWIAVALSSLADVLPPRFRAPGIGLFLAGFMLGFSFAPLFSIFMDHLYVALTSFLIAFCGFICTIVFVPETLPPSVAEEAKRRRQQLYNNNNDDTPQNFWYKLTKTLRWVMVRPIREMSILNRNTFFRLISLLAFFSGMVSSGDQLLLVYYIEEQLGFTDSDVSIMFLIIGIMGLLAQGVLLKPLNDCVGEKMVVAICFFIGAINNVMYGLAENKGTIYAAVALSALTGMAFPTISAIKSNNVDVSEQGRIQGALYSLQALASGVGPVLLRYVYTHSKETSLGPGSMFIFAGALYLVAVCTACALPKELANARRDHDDDENDDYIELNDDSTNAGLSDSNDDEEGDDTATLLSRSDNATTINQSGSYGSV